MKTYITFILSLSMLAWHSLAAQPVSRIEGRIVDDQTGQPIANVNISLVGTSSGASTDLDGKYFIPGVPPGTYQMSISCVGYATLDLTDIIVTSAKPMVVSEALMPTTIVGQEARVTAGLFRRELIAPTSTRTLSREEIRRFPGGFEDVVRTVSLLPGIAAVNLGGRNDLLVRGGGPTENLYIVNGLEVPNINHFGSQGSSSGSLSFVNLDFVDGVEFSSGGFGAESGDKLSSVLSLKMRPARSDHFGGKVLVSATQYGFNTEGPINDKGGIIFSARQSYLDLIFRAAGLPFIPVYTDFNLVANYDLTPRDKLLIIGLAALDRIERDQSSQENRVTNAGIMDNSQDQVITGVDYTHIGMKVLTNISVNLNDNSYRFSQVDENEEEYFASDAVEREAVLKANSKIHLTDHDELRSGFSYKTAWLNNHTSFADTIYDRNGRKIAVDDLGLPQTISIKTSADKIGSYLKHERSWSFRLETDLGVRSDYYNFLNDKSYIAPRFSVSFQLTDKTRLKSSIGTYYQSPAYVWTLNPVNRNLKALRNDMGVLGFNHLLNEYFGLTTEVYYKNYSNLPTGATPETSYLVLTNSGVGYGGREDNFQSFGYIPLVSSGTGEAYGLEISLQKKYSRDCCYGQAALSIGRSEYTAANGKTYPGQFDQRVIFSVSGGFKPNPRWEYSGKFRFWTGSPYTPVYRPSANPSNPGEIQNIPDEYLTKRLKEGHHLDLRVDRRFNYTGWTMIVFMDIQNVYNYRLETLPSYDFWEDKVDNVNGIGILPSIGISAEF